MEKCQTKDRLYNPVTKRCYKSCEQKKKETHPVTKKCRQKCKGEKIRRVEDFRCVKKTSKLNRTKKVYKKRNTFFKPEPKAPTPKAKAPTPKAKSPTPKAKAPTPKAKAPTPKAKAEELVPPPLQKDLQKNFTFINGFIEKGQNKTIQYNASMHVSELITIYFHEKYKQNCPMYPIKTYKYVDTQEFLDNYKLNKKNWPSLEAFKIGLLRQHKHEVIDWNKDKFLKNLKLCLETGEQIIIIPVRVPKHLNLLIIKVSTREVIRFEPHGVKYALKEEDDKTNDFLEKLTEDINAYLNLNANKKFKYVDPSKICPRYNTNANLPMSYYNGFQYMEARNRQAAKSEGPGFCQLWSWFFAECVINNPDMPVDEVYKEAYDIVKQNENNFATIIRGYFLSINDELKKMKKEFSIDKNFVSKLKGNDILLAYLNKNKGHLQAKERHTFVGGLKTSKFILPKANPNVDPVQF